MPTPNNSPDKEYVVLKLTVAAIMDDGYIELDHEGKIVEYDVCDFDCTQLCKDINDLYGLGKITLDKRTWRP
jgi:hypothetical protein